MAERSGLLIDWGGVLTTNLFGSFATFCEQQGLDPGAVAAAFRGDARARGLLEDLECGRIAPAGFERELAEVLGLAGHSDLIAGLFAGMRADEAMLDAVAAFKRAGVRTGLLSNSWGADTYDRSRFDELFDVLVISGEEGIRKPNPAIYDVAARRIGMAPEQLVFVDDLLGNLKPARAIGMATVHHTSAEQTIAELEALLGSRAGGPGSP